MHTRFMHLLRNAGAYQLLVSAVNIDADIVVLSLYICRLHHAAAEYHPRLQQLCASELQRAVPAADG